MIYTAFHFEAAHPKKLKADKMSLCAIRFSGIDELSKLSIETANFPELWKTFMAWYDGGILVGRKIKKTCGVLGTLFREHAITPPTDIKVISYIDLLGKTKGLRNDSYKSIAECLPVAEPDVHNVESKAEFTVFVMSRFRDTDVVLPIMPADFSEPLSRLTNYKKEGEHTVSRIPIAHLSLRPLSHRFEGTYIAFTGTLKTADKKMERKEAAAIVRQLGGIVTEGKIDQHVTHLVTGVQIAGRAKSQKEREAEEDGIILIPADVFFTLISY
jgi:NAD-dependent DNA ligase